MRASLRQPASQEDVEETAVSRKIATIASTTTMLLRFAVRSMVM
jgi:hypothetical protein